VLGASLDEEADEVTMPAQELSRQIEFGSRTFWALLPVFVPVLGIVVYALSDLRRVRQVRYLSKPIWALVIVLGSAPLGALAYLVAGKTHHEAERDDHRCAAGDGDTEGAEEGTHERVGLTGRHLSRYERGIRL
jgi:hypothetical protein